MSSYIQNIPHELYITISTFLVEDDLSGFKISCKKMQNILIWSCDNFGVHLCLGCDLTGSMNYVYNNLKINLLKTINQLKKTPNIGRTLASSMFFWDLERSSINKPYVQIQPPSENFSKQEELITYAQTGGGGGAECGGIALCELDMQFENIWINQHGGVFNKSMDILLMCVDAPFHFMVDEKNYFKKTRKHAINIDWIKSMHNLYKKGVLIIMIVINTQPCFTKSLRLLGGFNNALGGISITIEPDNLKDLPVFIQSIITEETQRKNHIYNIYKNIAFKYKNMKRTNLINLVLHELNISNIEIQCANIPESIIITADNVPLSKELFKCKTLKEAINAGIFESETVTSRLLHNKFSKKFPDSSHIPPLVLPPLMIYSMPSLVRQNTYSRSSPILRQITREQTVPADYKHVTNQENLLKKKQKNITNLMNTNKSSIITFGLNRQQSIAIQNNGSIIDGSIKCYINKPYTDFSNVPNELSNLIESNHVDDEIKFQNILKKKNVKQYELYMQGGLFGRFKPLSINDSLPTDCSGDLSQLNYQQSSVNDQSTLNTLINIIPLLTRSISLSKSINSRLLNTL
jgi:hypothetical protein